MYVASTIGLISKNFSYLPSHFSLDTATANLLEGGREIPLIQIKESWGSIAKWMIGGINVILSYIGKILYPRTFSFLSVPKVVMFPVLFTSILFVKRYIKTREKDIKRYAGLSLLILIWTVVYILRASHGRYLLPIVPAISIIYISVLYKYKYTPKQLKSMMIGTLIFVLLGFFFETSYVLLKILIEISMYILFLICMTKPKKEYFKHILVLLISSACLGVSILFAYTQGQVYGYINWGENRQVEEIAKILPKNDKYWCNNSENQMLVSVYTNERYSEPQWKWKLNEIVPRIDDLKVLGEQKSFVFPVKNKEDSLV
jgi:hypothetical protein